MNNGFFEKDDRVVGMLGGVARHGTALEAYSSWGGYTPQPRYSVAFDDGVTCHTMTQRQMQIESPMDSLARCGR
jgi:hypothetical protein